MSTISLHKFLFHAFLSLILVASLSACDSVEDNRIPEMPVSIDITGTGIWNTWGVAGWGASRRFILYNNTRIPNGFPFSQYAATGFGGVLLIVGQDPYTLEANTPLAYDLACPVECSPTIRVEIVNNENALPIARCPKCRSEYDVTDRAGVAIAVPALNAKYRLKNYSCIPGVNGGYLISNKM